MLNINTSLRVQKLEEFNQDVHGWLEKTLSIILRNHLMKHKNVLCTGETKKPTSILR